MYEFIPKKGAVLDAFEAGVEDLSAISSFDLQFVKYSVPTQQKINFFCEC